MTAADAAQPPPIPAAARGATDIAGRALRATATQAAREALPPGPGTGARARVDQRGGALLVSVEVDLPYPLGLPAACAAIRAHVRTRVAWLTGLPVTGVEVRVGHLVPVRGAAQGPPR